MDGSTSAYVGACRKDIPYPSVSHESVPSLIDNLVSALYGSITKTVVNRRVQWNIPCDPNNTATILGVARNAGEGLLCYFIRAFNETNTGGATYHGSFVGPLTGAVTGNVTGNVTGTASAIPDLIVSTAKIQDGAVTSAKIAANSVTAAKLGTNEQKQICKAWINFSGNQTAVTSKSYTRTTTTVTVTSVAHGLATGNTIVVSSATDTGINGTVIITVTGVDAFTFVTAATGANGTLSYTLTIRSSYSVSSITRNGTGDYTINLSITMADLNYVMVGSNSYALTTIGSSSGILAPYTKTTTTCRILTNAGNTPQESQEVDVVIFGN